MLTLVAWALLAAGIGLDSGQFHPVALVLVVAAEILLVRVVWRGGERGPARRSALLAPAAVVVLAVIAWPPVWYASGPWLPVSHVLAGTAVGAALWATASASATADGRAPRWALPSRGWWGVPAALSAAATVAMILAAPTPTIDVWVFGQQAADGLLDGRNAYDTTWVDSPGLQDVYPYLPWTTVLLAPFRWLLGDVRYGLLVALLLASWAARRLALRHALPGTRPDVLVLVPLLLLLLPRWTWSVAQAWTEPLLLAALAGAVWASAAGRRRTAAVLLGLALACKQHVALLVPLAARWPALGVRRTAGAALLAGALVLPWFVVDPAAFWSDAVEANLGLEPRRRSLGLASLAERLGLPWGFWATGPAVLAALVLAFRRLPRDAYGFLMGGALVLLTLDLVNQQSFFNHYTLPMGLLVLAALTAPPARKAGGAEAEDPEPELAER